MAQIGSVQKRPKNVKQEASILGTCIGIFSPEPNNVILLFSRVYCNLSQIHIIIINLTVGSFLP